MSQKQCKSRDKAAGVIPAKVDVEGEGKGRSDGGGKRKRHGDAGVISETELVGKRYPERGLNGKAEMTEKMKKKKKENSGEEVSEKESGGDGGKVKLAGNKDGEVRKGSEKATERREDGDGEEGKLEDVVNKNKKKKNERGGLEGEKAEREKQEDSEKGFEGGKIKGREDMTRKDDTARKSKVNRGSEIGAENISKALSSEGGKVEEVEVRKSSKKQRERKDKDVEKDEGDADDVEKKPGEESGLSRKQNQRNGDENADEKSKNSLKTNGTVSQSTPSVVLSLSRSMEQTRRDSLNKKNKEKSEGNVKKLGEPKSHSKKRKSNEGEIKDVMVPTSSVGVELEEGANKAEKSKCDGNPKFKKKSTSVEKPDEKDPKSCRCRLPLKRVNTIMKSHVSISKVTQESCFLICKATECFINQFCKDAFEFAASHGLSKVLKYEHLSSLVYNMDRYDFLSDYVPQKIKAKDALAEGKASESI